MNTQTHDDASYDTASFRIVSQKLESLLCRLHKRNVCGRCTARALLLRGAALAEHIMGSANAIELLDWSAEGADL
jgi:hypothetical protein